MWNTTSPPFICMTWKSFNSSSFFIKGTLIKTLSFAALVAAGNVNIHDYKANILHNHMETPPELSIQD